MDAAPLDLDALASRAAALTSSGRRALLGLAGPPGAGKSTLAGALAGAVAALLGDGSVARVPMDGFHLADVQLHRLGAADRKGAPDTFDADGYVALLDRLRTEVATTVYAPAFERDLEQPLAGAIDVGPGVRLVVTEGNYLLADGPWAAVAPRLDECWYLDLPGPERLRRLVARHERSGKSPDAARAWAGGTDQRNADLVAATRVRADLVVAVP